MKPYCELCGTATYFARRTFVIEGGQYGLLRLCRECRKGARR